MARVYEDILRQRLSRRRLLGSAASLSAAGAVISACGGGKGGSPTGSRQTVNPKETPTLGGIYRTRQTNVIPSVSPFGLTALISTLIFGFTTYDHLWYVPIDTGKYELMLASKLEIPNPDGTEVIATLYPSFFHDKAPVSGRAVVARDVVESWIAFRDDPYGLGREWLKNIMDKLEAPKDDTVRITQKHPWSWMFGTAGAGSPASSSVLPRETIKMDNLLRDNVIGSGRFFLAENNGGESIKFRKFPKWRIQGQPWLGGVDFVLITDYSQAEAQFAAGNIDNHSFQNKLQADAMKSRLGDKIAVDTELDRAYHCLMIKTTVKPFDDPRVRKAIRLAINRQEMIKLVERDNAGGVVSGIVPPAQKLYALDENDKDLTDYVRHDEKGALALLQEAGFPFDQEFTILISSPNEKLAAGAQVLKQQFARVNIKIKIEQQDLYSVWVPRVLIQADYQMTLFTHLPYEDPYLPLAFHTTFSPIGPADPRGRNSMLFYDKDIDAAVNVASAELDLNPQIEKVKAAQRVIMQKESPMINIYSSVNFNARHDWLKGVVTGRGSFGLFSGTTWIDSSLRSS